jgi:hypothetical protein
MPHGSLQPGVSGGQSKPFISLPSNWQALKTLSYAIKEAVKRHFCLSCVAQSALQQASCSRQKSERFNFADNHEQPIGQLLYSLSREALQQVVEFT